ncbi:sigma factor-like helix-turn-helix DNA-binding protein [Rhodococcus sp. NPDC003318]|uniref:sigma factor-like helix-turn-helix DNA-binding protein n=1 Tax=Rhodococcus sp. NPDC003318 TaxID=3364503 RepID=UPI0036D1DBEC
MTTASRNHGLIDALAERQRRVLHLRLVCGMATVHTARTLGCTPAVALRIQHEALNELRRRLRDS